MLIEFSCPHCKARLSAGENFAGKKGGCPNCNKELTIPREGTRMDRTAAETTKKV